MNTSSLQSTTAKRHWLGGTLFFGRGARGGVHAGRVVCRDQEALMESAGVGIRPSLVGLLHDDGCGGMAGVETWRSPKSCCCIRPSPENCRMRV